MTLNDLIHQRFGLATDAGSTIEAHPTLRSILGRKSCREYADTPLSEDLIQTLFAAAFSAPSKSDLQQVSVIRIQDKAKQQRISDMMPAVNFIAGAPLFMVWCGDSRRIRRVCEWRNHPFANDHLDAFMNAAVDAGIAMTAFIIAAEAMGLGCCPVSEIRDHIQPLSAELGLPKWVFPVAGLCVGYPKAENNISMRLPMGVTVHSDVYDDGDSLEQIADYDRRREAIEQTPPENQRDVEAFGVSEDYGWSENRSRQYSKPMRADFGAYIREQGFSLE